MSFTDNLHLEEVPNNGDIDTWDVPTNANWSIVDTMWGGSAAINATAASGVIAIATASYQCNIIIFSGVPGAATTYRMPTGVGGRWIFENNCTGSFSTLSIDSAAGGSAQTLTTGFRTIYTCDGTSTGMKSLSGIGAAGLNTQVQFNNGGVLGGSASLTWDGTTLSVTGNLHLITVGHGITYPDGTTQTSALTSGAAGSSTWLQFNTGGAFDASSKLSWDGTSLAVQGNITTNTGNITAQGYIYASGIGKYLRVASATFVNFPASSAIPGAIAMFTDGSTNTLGATVVGGGAFTVLAWANGTNWKVVAAL